MDQQKLQTALATDKAVDKIKAALGDQFKEGDTLKVKEHDHGTSATWHRPSDGQRVTANQARSPEDSGHGRQEADWRA